MIEGLKVRVPGRRVLELAMERVREHERKVERYQAAGANIAGADEDEGRVSSDPAAAVRVKVREHTQAASYWQMIADYADKGETYQLAASEIRALLGQERVY